jgi:hypothetical protein
MERQQGEGNEICEVVGVGIGKRNHGRDASNIRA